MPAYTAKLSIHDAAFPLLSRNAGRPAMISNLDSKANTEAATHSGNEGSGGVFNAIARPHIEYCENVLPRSSGFNSVGYIPAIVASIDVGTARFALPVKLFDAFASLLQKDAVFVFSKTTNVCAAYLYDGTTASLTMPYTAPQYISYANVQGDAYFLFATGTAATLYKADIDVGTGLMTWAAVTLTGIAAGDLNACILCCGAGNYLILAKADGTLYWNDPAIVTDFTPSDVTGAGFLIPAMFSGQLHGLQSHGDGYIIHGNSGSIFGRYSQNSLLPWIFATCYGSAAITVNTVNGMPVHTDSWQQAQQHVWTNLGLLVLSHVGNAQAVFPEVSDFLTAELLEVITPATFAGVPTIATAAGQEVIDVALSRIGGRYLCISYGQYAAGTPYFTQALVYDAALRRWGKLKRNHIGIIEVPPTFPLVEGLHAIGVVAVDGDVDIAYEETEYELADVEYVVTHEGVLILGGISFVRGGLSQLNRVSMNYGHLANDDAAAETITVGWSKAADGINMEAFTALPKTQIGRGTARFGTRKVAPYHFIKIAGSFHLTELEVELAKAGVNRG